MTDEQDVRPDPTAWLARVHEDVIEPDLVIVDPHHHLWSYPGSRGFQPVYLLDDLQADTASGHNVEATVFVECDWAYRSDGPAHLRCVGETIDVARQAATSEGSGGSRIAAIVSACDLTLAPAELAEVLDAHVEAGQGKFRGIRHRLANDATGAAHTSRAQAPRADLMEADAFRRGVAELERRGLRFEAWVYHPQLGRLADVVDAAPDTTFVLNHIGAPLGIGPYATSRDVVRSEWERDLRALARRSNIVVKVGGIGMPAYGSGWAGRDTPATSEEIADEWGDRLRFVIDTFGPERSMFESNFPVDKVSCSYRTLWNAFKLISAGYTEAERSALFAGTARHTYRIDPAVRQGA